MMLGALVKGMLLHSSVHSSNIHPSVARDMLCSVAEAIEVTMSQLRPGMTGAEVDRWHVLFMRRTGGPIGFYTGPAIPPG